MEPPARLVTRKHVDEKEFDKTPYARREVWIWTAEWIIIQLFLQGGRFACAGSNPYVVAISAYGCRESSAAFRIKVNCKDPRYFPSNVQILHCDTILFAHLLMSASHLYRRLPLGRLSSTCKLLSVVPERAASAQWLALAVGWLCSSDHREGDLQKLHWL